MSDKSAMVVFQPSGRRGHVPLGITIIEASRRIGVDIEALCGEKQVCGKCKVRVESGRFEKYNITSKPEHAGPWQVGEERFVTVAERAEGYRLGCAAVVGGDLLIFVPEASQAGKQVVSKSAQPIEVDYDPAVKYYTVSCSAPTLADPLADFERLCMALETDFGLTGLTIDLFALRRLAGALREGNWQVTVSVWMDKQIIRVRPGQAAATYGLAVDVGTTTIAAYLCRLDDSGVVHTETMMNPQVKYGEDVISRISYHMNHDDGLMRMSQDLIEGLNVLIARAVTAVSTMHATMTADDIEDMVICGNTAMQHILLRLDPEPLGVLPFTPANQQCLNLNARSLGLAINPGANLLVLPNAGGFVGGDNVAAIIACKPHLQQEMHLLIDIGTNGELVLGNRDQLLYTSCATGPALEGAQIEFGMRAAPGAIERVKIDPDTLDVDYKVVGRLAWRRFSEPQQMRTKGICGSGILDVVAALYQAGIVLKSGAFNKALDTPRLRQNAHSKVYEFVLAWAEETSIGRDVVITQKDIRQIQMAKAAIYTGCKLMMRRLGVMQPARIDIAGAFGAHIDRTLALVMGLIPDCPVQSIHSVGNAAGDGCRMVLLDRRLRQVADALVRQAEFVELTAEDDFQQELVAATQIPHMHDEFIHLEGLVAPEILRQ